MPLDDWREPKTRAVSIHKTPSNFSCDNGVLFTVVAHELGLVSKGDCAAVIWKYSALADPGMLQRHPESTQSMSWDDHLAACVASQAFAKVCLFSMRQKKWTTWDGKWLGRFPVFPPLVKACAGERLTLWDQMRASVAFLWNLFEKREETSGKQLLWLAQRALRDKGLILKLVTRLWRWEMQGVYPGGFKQLVAIYYQNSEHPFHAAAGSDFL